MTDKRIEELDALLAKNDPWFDDALALAWTSWLREAAINGARYEWVKNNCYVELRSPTVLKFDNSKLDAVINAAMNPEGRQEDPAEVERRAAHSPVLPEGPSEHIETDECGFDRNASITEDQYVCLCGWRSHEDMKGNYIFNSLD